MKTPQRIAFAALALSPDGARREGNRGGDAGTDNFWRSYNCRDWTHFLELRLPDGKWVAAEEISCKK